MPRTPRGLKGVLWGRETSAAGVRVPCHWCGEPLTYECATVDHHPPLAEGGSPRSAVLACDRCNQERGRETNDRVNAKRRRKAKKGRGQKRKGRK